MLRMYEPAAMRRVSLLKQILLFHALSVGIPIFQRPELRESLADFRSIADRDHLRVVERDVFSRYALNVLGRDLGDLFRIRVPVVGREAVLLDHGGVAECGSG